MEFELIKTVDPIEPKPFNLNLCFSSNLDEEFKKRLINVAEIKNLEITVKYEFFLKRKIKILPHSIVDYSNAIDLFKLSNFLKGEKISFQDQKELEYFTPLINTEISKYIAEQRKYYESAINSKYEIVR